jgi:acetolactate decarboxylase
MNFFIMRIITISFILFCLFSCTQNNDKEEKHAPTNELQTAKPDTYYQYSIWWAFVNKVFDGDLTVSELKQRGDIGLGSFDFLDGEMVMLDGIPYRIRENGEITEGKDEEEIVYANAAFFENDESIIIPEPVNSEGLRNAINFGLPSHNYFYAFKIHGVFSTLKLGGLNKQSKPFVDGLDVLIPNRPVFKGENITGTMIGFYCPEFIGNINVAGYHFHFISDDKKMGGHVMEFQSEGQLEVQTDKMNDYHFALPDNQDFENVKLDKEFQYKKN